MGAANSRKPQSTPNAKNLRMHIYDCQCRAGADNRLTAWLHVGCADAQGLSKSSRARKIIAGRRPECAYRPKHVSSAPTARICQCTHGQGIACAIPPNPQRCRRCISLIPNRGAVGTLPIAKSTLNSYAAHVQTPWAWQRSGSVACIACLRKSHLR